MSETTLRRENGHDDSTGTLDDRDVRALTERMGVLPDDGDGLHTVAGENGGTYTVDVREGRCTCPDAEHNLPTDDGRATCKHVARARFATGRRAVPAWVDRGAVDAMLGAHVDATPQVAATDGGAEIVDAGDEGEVLDEPAAPEWVGPFSERDKYGKLTGERFVRCSACGIEVLVGHTDAATHARDCPAGE